MPLGLRLEDLPKTIRPAVLVLALAAILLVAGAGAYAGGMAKAQDVARETATSVAAAGDAAVRRELDAVAADVRTEKARVEEKFSGVAEQIRLLREEQIRTNQKLDRLIELQQGRR